MSPVASACSTSSSYKRRKHRPKIDKKVLMSACYGAHLLGLHSQDHGSYSSVRSITPLPTCLCAVSACKRAHLLGAEIATLRFCRAAAYSSATSQQLAPRTDFEPRVFPEACCTPLCSAVLLGITLLCGASTDCRGSRAAPSSPVPAARSPPGMHGRIAPWTRVIVACSVCLPLVRH